MCARVPSVHCVHAVRGNVMCHFFVAQQRAQMAFHFGAVFCHEKIAAWLKQVFAVVPWRTHEWNPARERFEWANRRDSRQEPCIRSAWHVQCDAEARECFRHAVIRQPAAIANSRIAQHVECVLRITYTEDFGAQPKSLDGFYEELA